MYLKIEKNKGNQSHRGIGTRNSCTHSPNPFSLDYRGHIFLPSVPFLSFHHYSISISIQDENVKTKINSTLDPTRSFFISFSKFLVLCLCIKCVSWSEFKGGRRWRMGVGG
jgi:hypothetical protein